MIDMTTNRALADEQCTRDLPVGETLGKQLGHLTFAPRQPARAVFVLVWSFAVVRPRRPSSRPQGPTGWLAPPIGPSPTPMPRPMASIPRCRWRRCLGSSVNWSTGARGNTDERQQVRARGEQLGRADWPTRRGVGCGETSKAFSDPLVVPEFRLQASGLRQTALVPGCCPRGID